MIIDGQRSILSANYRPHRSAACRQQESGTRDAHTAAYHQPHVAKEFARIWNGAGPTAFIIRLKTLLSPKERRNLINLVAYKDGELSSARDKDKKLPSISLGYALLDDGLTVMIGQTGKRPSRLTEESAEILECHIRSIACGVGIELANVRMEKFSKIPEDYQEATLQRAEYCHAQDLLPHWVR